MYSHRDRLATRGTGARAAATLLTFLAALALVIQGLAVPAVAAVNPAIEVTNLTLKNVNGANVEQSGPLKKWSLALLSFDWDASKTTPKEGDSFTIGLPEEFKFNSSIARDMTYQGQTVGECTIADKVLTCTFNSEITALVAAGNKDIHGSGEFQLAITKTTTEEELPFVINGDKTVKVDLPDTGGIQSGDSPYTPTDLLKGHSGWMKEGATRAKWYISFGTAVLAGPLGVTFDGVTDRTLTVKDTLGAGMKCPLSLVGLYIGKSEAEPNNPDFLLDKTGTDQTAGGTNTEYGTYELTAVCGEMQSDGTTPITFTATGPFRANANYKIAYDTEFTTGVALAGFKYNNKVQIVGYDKISSATASFVVGGSVTVTMRQGEGNFSITKYVAPDYSNQVQPGTTFDVTFNYALPEGTTAASFPNWTPPANADGTSTLNADQRTGTATLKVTVGSKTPFGTPFPAGTTITALSEDTSSGSPALPAGYTWAAPAFTIGQTPTTSLTIEDQKVTDVTLTNTVARVETNVFQVVKRTKGAGEAVAKDYVFDYNCSNGVVGRISAKGDGVAVKSDTTFPVGTTCEVTEVQEQAGIDGYTPDFSEAGAQTITIGAASAETATATFVNKYTRNTGTFTVAKVVAGDYTATANDTFTVGYECNDAGNTTGELAVVAGGVAVSGPVLPVGTSCTLTEDTDEAQRAGFSLATSYSATSVTVAKEPVAVTVTNTYTQDTGRFVVSKTVKGDAGDAAPGAYVFDYVCQADGKDDITGDFVVARGGTNGPDKDIPVGYRCTVAERVAKGQPGTAYLEGYTLDTVIVGGATIVKGGEPVIDVTNTYTRNTGTFTVAKVVAGDYTAQPGESFTVGYECNDAGNTTGELTVAAGGMAVNGPVLPVGTSCTLTEDTDEAQRAGFSLATSYSATSVTVAKEPVAVTVTNTYTALKGRFMIAKTVDGDGAGLVADREFIFSYACAPTAGGEQVTGSVTLKGGQSKSVENVPVGECIISERDATVGGADLSTVLSVDGRPVAGKEAVFSVADGATVSVAATNTYTLDRGSFSVAKTVVGGQDSYKQDTFVFDYTCTDGTMGRLDVPGDGTAVTSPAIPAGAQCTVSERAESAGRAGYTVVSQVSGGGKVTIAKDTVSQLSATNTYSPVPTPTPSATKPGRPLARTGASDVVLLGIVGVVLVVAGGGLAVLVKRRRDDA